MQEEDEGGEHLTHPGCLACKSLDGHRADCPVSDEPAEPEHYDMDELALAEAELSYDMGPRSSPRHR